MVMPNEEWKRYQRSAEVSRQKRKPHLVGGDKGEGPQALILSPDCYILDSSKLDKLLIQKKGPSTCKMLVEAVIVTREEGGQV